MGSIASAVGGVVGSIGGMISGDAAAGAANEQADYLRNLSAEQRKNITDAAAAAAARGQFKPVTVTSSFGTPQYTYDESGRLIGVSTTPASWLQQLQQRQTGLLPQYMGLTEAALSSAPEYAAAAGQARQAGTSVYDIARQTAAQQAGLYGVGQEMYGLSRGLQPQVQGMYATGQELTGMGRQAAGQAQGLFGQAQGLYGQAQGLYGTGAGLYDVAQGMYGTGATLQGAGADIYQRAAQALPTSYDTAQATQDYYNRMQQMVAPQREQQLAQTRLGLFNKGRQGLATGATQAGGMLATNPEMAAYYNAIAQQDLSLANQAEQQALSNLAQRTNIGQGLYSTGLQQYQAGLGAQQQGVGTTQTGANIIGQGIGATQAGIGATQAGLGAMTTGGSLIGQGLGATQAGMTGVGQMANILGQGIGATQAGIGAGTSAASQYGAGTGLFGMAGDLQNALYRNVAASQAPFTTGMAATTGLEQTAYSPVTQGMQYAGLVTPAEQWAGQIGLTGATAAANVAGQYAPAIANYQYQNSAYSPWGTLLQGMGGSLGQSNLGSWGSLFGSSGGGMSMPGTTNWSSFSSPVNPFQYAQIGK